MYISAVGSFTPITNPTYAKNGIVVDGATVNRVWLTLGADFVQGAYIGGANWYLLDKIPTKYGAYEVKIEEVEFPLRGPSVVVTARVGKLVRYFLKRMMLGSWDGESFDGVPFLSRRSRECIAVILRADF